MKDQDQNQNQEAVDKSQESQTSETERSDNGDSAFDADAKKAFAARDRAKKEARELGQAKAALEAELSELRAFKEAQAEKEAVSRQDYEKARSIMESQMKAALEEAKQAKSQLQEIQNTAKRSQLIAGLAKKADNLEADEVEAFVTLLEAKGQYAMPDAVDDDALDGALTVLKQAFPKHFSPKNLPPGNAGFNPKNKAPGQSPSSQGKGFEIGQRLSYRPKRE